MDACVSFVLHTHEHTHQRKVNFARAVVMEVLFNIKEHFLERTEQTTKGGT